MEREIEARTKTEIELKTKTGKEIETYSDRYSKGHVLKIDQSSEFLTRLSMFQIFFSIKQSSNQQLSYTQYLVTNVIFFRIPSDPNAIA